MASLVLGVVATPANASLSSPAQDDYASWAGPTASLAPTIRKNGGGSTISAALYNLGSIEWYDDGGGRTLSGTDGTPTASWSHNNTGRFNGRNNGGTRLTGDGFEVYYPANTGARTARLWIGTYAGTLRVTAIISDASTANQVSTGVVSAADGAGAQGVVTVDYSAASAGQTLTIRVELNAANGDYANPTISAASWVGSGGTAYALPYDAASYSLTNAAETFRATRSLPVAATSYALSGAAETLSVGRKLRVDAASYTATTSNETLTAARALNLAPVSYSLSAADVTLAYASLNKAMDVDPVVYRLRLQDVEFTAPRRGRDDGEVSYPGPAKRRKSKTYNYDYSSPKPEVVEQAKTVKAGKVKKAIPADVAEMMQLLEASQSITAKALAGHAAQRIEDERRIQAMQAEEEEFMAVIACCL